MSEGAERFSPDFWRLTAASMLVGGYAIMLLSLTLMFGNDAGFSSAAAGVLSSVFAFASLGIRPFSGLLCDKFSPKALLLAAAAGFALTPLVFLLPAPYAVLAAARLAQGLCMGVASTALAAMATALIPRARFTEGIGYYGIGMSASSALAPGIGLWLRGRFGYGGVFLFSSLLGLVTLALALPVILPPAPAKKAAARGALWRELYEPTALFATAITLALTLAQVTILQFLAYRVREAGMNGTGVFFPLSTLAVIGARSAAGWLRRRASDRRLMAAGFLLLIAAYLGLFLLSPTPGALALLALLYGLGHSLSGMVLNSMAVSAAPQERLGAANATYLAAGDLGFAVGPVLWNLYCAQAGYRSPYLLASLLTAAMFALVLAKLRMKHN